METGVGFTYTSVSHPNFKEQVEQQSHGTAQANVSAASIMGIPIVIPTIQIRNCFDNIVAPIFEKLLSNYGESDTLKSMRDLLIPRLLSGELSVGKIKSTS